MKTEMFQKPIWTKKGKYLVTSELFLDVIFTSNCNCNCSFCISKTKEYAREEFQSWREGLEKAFSSFLIRNVIILGGEATIDPLFWEKLECLEKVVDRSKTDHIILTTNGIALRKEGFLDRICSSAIDSVNLSYMHYDKLVNDTIFSNKTLSRDEIKHVFQSLRKAGKTLRLNTNIYKGNLDTVDEMESFVRYFIGCCDTIKFSPLMATDMFDTVDSVTRYTKSVSIPDDDIRIIYDAFAQRHKKNREAHNVLGFVDYCELDVFDQNVLLKYAQVEDKYNRDTVIPTLKLYPNGTLSNEWDFKKNIEV